MDIIGSSWLWVVGMGGGGVGRRDCIATVLKISVYAQTSLWMLIVMYAPRTKEISPQDAT